MYVGHTRGAGSGRAVQGVVSRKVRGSPPQLGDPGRAPPTSPCNDPTRPGHRVPARRQPGGGRSEGRTAPGPGHSGQLGADPAPRADKRARRPAAFGRGGVHKGPVRRLRGSHYSRPFCRYFRLRTRPLPGAGQTFKVVGVLTGVQSAASKHRQVTLRAGHKISL